MLGSADRAAVTRELQATDESCMKVMIVNNISAKDDHTVTVLPNDK